MRLTSLILHKIITSEIVRSRERIAHRFSPEIFFFVLLTSYWTASRDISSCNVKLELEKRKVVCGAEVIKGVGCLFRVVTEGGWRGIGDTVDVRRF